MTGTITKIDLVGQRFGRLVVAARSSKSDANHNAYWECSCDCGGTKIARGSHLRSQLVPSCGCYTREVRSENGRKSKTHGMSRSPEYRVWAEMIQRCTNPNSTAYHDYGARGISVDQSWLSFDSFIADMGRRPTPNHTIERINNSLGYSAVNCVWETRTRNLRNRRNNRMLTLGGKTQCVGDWADELGVKRHAIQSRVSRGWSDQRALTFNNIAGGGADLRAATVVLP